MRSVSILFIDVYIRRLCSVLTRLGYSRHIQTVRGTGYRFSLATGNGTG